MTATPRYLVQLSSAEIAFLHALVQRQLRGFVAERPDGRGLDWITAPPELVSLDRRLLARLREVSDDEEAYFAGQGRRRPEAVRIGEEHAALAEAARSTGVTLAGCAVTRALALAPGEQAGNVVPLRGAGRRPTTAQVG